jgi:alpha-tubulin suppressor-like RCC1 family protein
MFLSQSGQLYACGYNYFGQLGLGDDNNRNIPTSVKFKEPIRMVSAGGLHSMFLSESGQLYTFGDNNNRNVPTLVEFKEPIRMISTGNCHLMFLTESGQLYTWGRNDYGQLGLGDQEDRNSPTYVLTDPSIIQLNNSQISFPWSPQHHRYFPLKYKQEVNLLCLCLKHRQHEVKIPKFIIYEIIKFLDQ